MRKMTKPITRSIAAETTVTLDYPASQRGWRAAAACRGADTAIFFQSGAHSVEAMRLCASCTVTEECAGYAATTPLTVGMWAGEYHSADNLRWNELTAADADMLEERMNAGERFADVLESINEGDQQ
jgi:hypothetical protein